MRPMLLKDPDEQSLVLVDWADRLVEGESLLDDLGWTVFPADAPPDGLALGAAALSGSEATIFATGGRAGGLYRLTHRVRTTHGRVLERSAVLRVAQQ